MAKQTKKNILFTVGGQANKETLLPVMKQFADLGCVLYATEHTSKFMDEKGITNHIVYKVSEENRPNIEDLTREHRFDLIINIPSPEGNGTTKTDGETIRELAVMQNIPLVTDIMVAGHMVEKVKERK